MGTPVLNLVLFLPYDHRGESHEHHGLPRDCQPGEIHGGRREVGENTEQCFLSNVQIYFNPLIEIRRGMMPDELCFLFCPPSIVFQPFFLICFSELKGPAAAAAAAAAARIGSGLFPRKIGGRERERMITYTRVFFLKKSVPGKQRDGRNLCTRVRVRYLGRWRRPP